LSHALILFVSFYFVFQIAFYAFALPSLDHNLPVSSFWVAGITGINPPYWAPNGPLFISPLYLVGMGKTWTSPGAKSSNVFVWQMPCLYSCLLIR
jgi:hypothetical protein